VYERAKKYSIGEFVEEERDSYYIEENDEEEEEEKEEESEGDRSDYSSHEDE